MCLDTVCADFVAPCHFFIDSDNRLLSNILFVVRAIDGARGPVDLGFARTVSRHPVDVGFETTETKCRREAETLELRAPDGARSKKETSKWMSLFE